MCAQPNRLLAESISILGLPEALLLDTWARLLAGGHRLAALQLLDIEDSDGRQTEFLKRIDNSEGAVETRGVGKLEERLAVIGIRPREACISAEVAAKVEGARWIGLRVNHTSERLSSRFAQLIDE